MDGGVRVCVVDGGVRVCSGWRGEGVCSGWRVRVCVVDEEGVRMW